MLERQSECNRNHRLKRASIAANHSVVVLSATVKATNHHSPISCRMVDEPLANRCFDTIEDLDQAVGERCVALAEQRDMIRDSTLTNAQVRLAAPKRGNNMSTV